AARARHIASAYTTASKASSLEGPASRVARGATCPFLAVEGVLAVSKPLLSKAAMHCSPKRWRRVEALLRNKPRGEGEGEVEADHERSVARFSDEVLSDLAVADVPL